MKVYLKPLEGKYYCTELIAENEGKQYIIEIATSYPSSPSSREYAKDIYIEDYYDNHTECSISYRIARIIQKALSEVTIKEY